jgi:hypothetical protein
MVWHRRPYDQDASRGKLQDERSFLSTSLTARTVRDASSDQPGDHIGRTGWVNGISSVRMKFSVDETVDNPTNGWRFA